MQAIILAAGIGNRLGDEAGNKPKSMLEFNGKSLLQRHVELLKRNGVNQVNLVVGYQSELIIEHLKDSSSDIRFIHNPRYTEGSLISLNCARDIMLQESQYLIMDADVLYDEKILSRLIKTDIPNCLLIDRDFVPGDEPVKVCIDGRNRIVEFRKKVAPALEFDKQGESVGFFKFDNIAGSCFVDRIDTYLARNENDTPYEEAIRDCILKDPGHFGYEDITGLAWIEIDFPEDIMRARDEILPNI